jgi:hypothetical protein
MADDPIRTPGRELKNLFNAWDTYKRLLGLLEPSSNTQDQEIAGLVKERLADVNRRLHDLVKPIMATVLAKRPPAARC